MHCNEAERRDDLAGSADAIATRGRTSQLGLPFDAEYLQGAVGGFVGFGEFARHSQAVGLLAKLLHLRELGFRDLGRWQGLVDGDELAGGMVCARAGEGGWFWQCRAPARIPTPIVAASANRDMDASFRVPTAALVAGPAIFVHQSASKAGGGRPDIAPGSRYMGDVRV